MTIKELIFELQKYDDNLIIVNEYSGESVVSVFEYENYIVIE